MVRFKESIGKTELFYRVIFGRENNNIYNLRILCRFMKGVMVSLFILVMMFSFAVAESSSSIRADFYIQQPGEVGGYEEDVADTSSLQTEWLSKVIYWAVIVIAFAILVKLLKVVGRKKSKSKKSKKKSRRKK